MKNTNILLPDHLTSQLPNREVESITKLSKEGDFDAYNHASKLLVARGKIVAPMCSPEPTGFADASKYDYIAKWRNLTNEERNMVEGVILADSFRNGPVYIVTFKS